MTLRPLKPRPLMLWYVAWCAMAVIAVTNLVASYPLLSGPGGMLFSILLAAVAAVQILLKSVPVARKDAALMAVVLACFCVAQLSAWMRSSGGPSLNRSMNFSAYYVAGRLVSEAPPQSPYHLPRFADGRMKFVAPTPAGEEWQRIAFRYGVPTSMPYIYPPLFAVLLRPFSHLPYEAAYVVWRGVSIAFVMAAVWLTLSLTGTRRNSRMAVVLLVGLASYYPLHDELLLGEVGCLLFLLVAGGVWLLDRGRWGWSAGLFALATVVKLTPVIAVPVMLIHRRWRWLATYLGTIGLLLLLSVWQAGWQAHRQFVREVLPAISCGAPVCQNASAVATVQDLMLGYVPESLHEAVALTRLECSLPKWVAAAVYAAMLLRLWRGRRRGAVVRELVLMALLSLALAPISWWHQYTLALLPILYLWGKLPADGKDGLLLATAVAVGTNVVGLAMLLAGRSPGGLALATGVPGLTIALVYARLGRGVGASVRSESSDVGDRADAAAIER